MPALFVRITQPWTVVERVVTAWNSKCDKLVVYEHEGNEQGKKWHCHLALTSSVGIKQLRRLAEAVGVPMAGNENSAAKAWEIDETGEIPLTYMSKGNLQPKFLKGYLAAEAEAWRAKWVQRQTYKVPSRYDLLWTAFAEDPTVCLPIPKTWISEAEFMRPDVDPEVFIKSNKAAHATKQKLAIVSFLKKRHNNLWSPPFEMDKKCLMNTFEMRYGFSLA